MLDQIYREGTDILLAPLLPTQFMRYNSMLNPLGISFNLTNYIDFLETNNIVAKTWRGAIPLFTYIHTFSLVTWMFIILCILIISFISTHKISKNFNIITVFIWHYFTLMFSKSIQSFLLNQKLRLLLGIWLIVSLFISTLFTAVLLDHMVRPVPVLYIDSIEQLAQRTDIQVVARSDGPLVEYINSINTSASKEIDDKLIKYVNFEDIRHLVMSGLRNGSIAFVNNRLTLIYCLQETAYFAEMNHMYGTPLIDLVHISRSNWHRPYFTFVNKATKYKTLLKDYNTM